MAIIDDTLSNVVVVCGGQSAPSQAVYAQLTTLHRLKCITKIVECGNLGAERYAREWAVLNKIPVCTESRRRYRKCFGVYGGEGVRLLNIFKHRPVVVLVFGTDATSDSEEIIAKAERLHVQVIRV